ncbi:hypothetical protein LCM10_09405 [Rossellomorea aquimaris]|uniref:DUF6574 domain-containing protein n=1 Tax=Rossellomorea aquimaris TaxID=189382 RepID=UPI001CD57F00|nr:DUF6574 domain-containing protein [Rossellomorea aquimaris]MCA1055203.1 hypothetical protein [Rossellomorea aquimaris]
MMTCPSCLNEQNGGKFCGKCGTNLVETEGQPQPAAHAETAATAQTAPVNTNENMQKAKEGVSKYWNYALGVLKNPSKALASNESQFLNGIITIAIFVVALSLSIYFLANKYYKEMFGGIGSLFSGDGMEAQSLPFFQMNSALVMFALLFILGAIVSVFLAAKLMSEAFTVKTVLARFGGVLVPLAAMNVLAMLFGLMGSIKFTLLFTGVSLLIAIVLMPTLVVYDRAVKSQRATKGVYWSLGASAVSVLITYFIIRTSVLDFMDEFESLFNLGF